MNLRKILEEFNSNEPDINRMSEREYHKLNEKRYDLAHQQILELMPKKKDITYIQNKIKEIENMGKPYPQEIIGWRTMLEKYESFNEAISEMEQSMTGER